MKLRLPATSANLGPGFDTLALALKLYLEIEAEESDAFSIEATGRNPDICSATENNLLAGTYHEVLARASRRPVPLRVRVANQIPLGMGCGSSAAVRLAGVALAAHYGELGWGRERILAEAARLEGHPDNAAACWLGGFVASANLGDSVQAISFAPPAAWRALIVMPDQPLSTSASRAALPDSYPRRDVIENLQRVALLTAAFAAGKPDAIANGMRDWLHQPYRAPICPLLPRLLPMAGKDGILGVALSGAGPAVLVLAETEAAAAAARERIAEMPPDGLPPECLLCELEAAPAMVDPGGE